MSRKDLAKAKTQKEDEFYTLLSPIEKELPIQALPLMLQFVKLEFVTLFRSTPCRFGQTGKRKELHRQKWLCR